jgi:putative acetyltransferase
VIRSIEVADADEVARIARRARFAAITGLADLHTAEEDRAFFRAEIGSKHGAVWVDDEGAIAGFALWHGQVLDHLYVHPDRQRAGIGTQLLDRAIALLGPGEVRLWTFQANARARAFYAARGFQVEKATDGSATEERLPDLLLVRRPDAP